MTKVSIKSIKTEYRPSGVDWLGNIPAKWEIKPLLYFAHENHMRNTSEANTNVLSLSYGRVIKKEKIEGGLLPASFSIYQIMDTGDIVMRLTDLQNDHVSLRTGLVMNPGIITSAYLGLKIWKDKINIRFFHWLLHSYDLQKIFYNMGGGVRQSIGFSELKWLPILLPDNETQKRIADFLDEKTKIVDDLIAKREELIALLREKRAALIIRAVTKGLNPSVKLKSSGVEWLGDIPGEWKVRKGKFVFRYKKELNSKYQCDHILALTLRGVINKEDYEARSLTPTDYASYQIFYPNDLVFKLIDLENFQTSRVGIVSEKGIMSPAYLRVVPAIKIVPKFFYWFYYSLYLHGIFNFLGMGVRSTLNQDDLLRQFVILPSIREQKQIADFLDVETMKIDKTVSLIESQIEKLKEYRSSLIYHAVTGKVKV